MSELHSAGTLEYLTLGGEKVLAILEPKNA